MFNKTSIQNLLYIITVSISTLTYELQKVDDMKNVFASIFPLRFFIWSILEKIHVFDIRLFYQPTCPLRYHRSWKWSKSILKFIILYYVDLPKPVLRPGSVGPTYLPLTQMMPFALQRSWTLHDLSYKSILLSMFHKVVLNPHHLLCICLTVRGHFCPNNSVSVTNSVFYASHHNLQLYLSPILVFLLGFVDLMRSQRCILFTTLIFLHHWVLPKDGIPHPADKERPS